ncbi:MAG: O-antigen ligase family protein [Fimbriimonadaceae bacterium]|nr:O-antigen ligase family protein [Fimbriimonadaceae bacterium]
MKPLVGAPYIRGEIGAAKNKESLFAMVAGTLFVVMPLAFIACQLIGIEPELAFVGVWFIATMLAIYAEYYIKPSKKLNSFQILSLSIVAIGIPGLFYLRPNSISLLQILAYVGILAMRLIVVFIIIPRCISTSKKPPIEQVIRWLIVGTAIIAIATNFFYFAKGFTIFNGTRGAFDNWLHPNLCSLMGSIVVIFTFLDPHLKMWVRALLIGSGTYTMLVAQGRSALVSTILVLLLLFLMTLSENPKKYALRGFLGAIGIALVLGLFGGALSNLPVIRNIFKRTFETNDPTAGRLEIFSQILEVWQNSQIFGYGFRSGGADSLYVTMLLQTGLVGLLCYFVLFGAIVYKGIQHFVNSRGANKLLGKFIIVASASLFLRSFTEGTSLLQLTDVLSNSFCIAGGIAFISPVGRRRTITPNRVTRTVLQTEES